MAKFAPITPELVVEAVETVRSSFDPSKKLFADFLYWMKTGRQIKESTLFIPNQDIERQFKSNCILTEIIFN
jgi:hypothetical protein